MRQLHSENREINGFVIRIGSLIASMGGVWVIEEIEISELALHLLLCLTTTKFLFNSSAPSTISMSSLLSSGEIRCCSSSAACCSTLILWHTSNACPMVRTIRIAWLCVIIAQHTQHVICIHRPTQSLMSIAMWIACKMPAEKRGAKTIRKYASAHFRPQRSFFFSIDVVAWQLTLFC